MTHTLNRTPDRARRRGARMAAALAGLCIGATLALSACSSFPYSNQTLTAQVKAIDGQTVTLQPGERGEAQAEAPAKETVAFTRLGDEAFAVGDTSVYTTDEATRAQATIDPAVFDASFPISFDGEAIAYDNPHITNEVVDGVTVLTIGAGGSYDLAGTLPAGRIVIDTPEPVRLTLNGVTIENEKGAVIERTTPGTLVLAPAAGASNTLSTTAPAEGDAGVAAVSGWGAVIVSGEGALLVESASGNGIEALDTRATETTTDAATKTDDAAAPTPGVIGVKSATLGISAGNHGLYATDYLSVTGGVLDVTANEDALASDRDVRVAGGDLAIDAGDDAIHGDFTLVFEGGALTAGSCKEGFEAERLYLREGAAQITSSDDGVNAAAPEAYDDETPDSYREIESCVVAIGGGAYRIDASGDGIDSNGSLQMNGATVLVSAPESGDNTALDYDGEAVLVGGTGVFVGAAGMTQGFTEADQAFVSANAKDAANEPVTLATTEAAVIVSWTPPKGASAVTITAPGLADGASYELVTGGTIEPAAATTPEGALAGLATTGTVEGGAMKSVTAGTAATAADSGAPAAGARMYGAPEGAQGQQPKGAPADGETPPEPPDGEANPDGAEPPTPPDGEGTRPMPPDAAGDADGAAPPDAAAFTPSDAATFTLTLSADQASTLAVGDIVEITFGAGETVESLTVIGAEAAR